METPLDVNLLRQHFMERAKAQPKFRVAVVHPCSEEALTGAVDAAESGLIEPVLVGPAAKITALAKECGVDISAYELVDVPHSHAAAEAAAKLAGGGKVQALMKGSLHTDELMAEFVRAENGLRTERRISHVFAMATDHYHKPFFITDAAINIAPDLLMKRDIVQNAVDLFLKVQEGKRLPKVALLAAVETVNPKMQATIDAACLCKMAERGQIEHAIVDGPLGYDNALSLKAASIKGITSKVAGDVDIFVTPDLESGNMLVKQLVLMVGASAAGIVLGARVPVILTSRSDGPEARVASCALAVLMVSAGQRSRPFPKG